MASDHIRGFFSSLQLDGKQGVLAELLLFSLALTILPVWLKGNGQDENGQASEAESTAGKQGTQSTKKEALFALRSFPSKRKISSQRGSKNKWPALKGQYV